jgi:hypothetical protein
VPAQTPDPLATADAFQRALGWGGFHATLCSFAVTRDRQPPPGGKPPHPAADLPDLLEAARAAVFATHAKRPHEFETLPDASGIFW